MTSTQMSVCRLAVRIFLVTLCFFLLLVSGPPLARASANTPSLRDCLRVPLIFCVLIALVCSLPITGLSQRNRLAIGVLQINCLIWTQAGYLDYPLAFYYHRGPDSLH